MKTVNKRNNKKIKIKTQNGFEEFSGIQKLVRDCVKFKTENFEIEVSSNHIFQVKGFLESADQLKIGDRLETILGIEQILSIEKTGSKEVYDLLEVGQDHTYYTNGILSHNCSFTGSSYTLVHGDHLAKLSVQEPIESFENFSIYEEPKEDHFYVCGVDTGKYSDEGDFSSYHILDITRKPFKQVASFRGRNLTYLDMVDPVFEACVKYNNALLFVENNSGDGQSMVDLLAMKHEYEYIYVEKQPVYGFRTTTKSRKVGLQNLKKFVESGMLEIVDKSTIEELQFFALKGGKYQAVDGYSDDAVMALVASLFFLQDPSYVDSEELYESIFKKDDEDDEDDFFIFGFTSDSGGTSFF